MASTNNLGKYTFGEKPAALAVTLKDNDGVVMNITGYTVACVWWIKGQNPVDTPIEFGGSVSDGANGLVSVPWGTQSSSPFEDAVANTPYTVEMEVWAGNGTIRTASEKFRWAVLTAVATTIPSV